MHNTVHQLFLVEHKEDELAVYVHCEGSTVVDLSTDGWDDREGFFPYETLCNF